MTYFDCNHYFLYIKWLITNLIWLKKFITYVKFCVIRTLFWILTFWAWGGVHTNHFFFILLSFYRSLATIFLLSSYFSYQLLVNCLQNLCAWLFSSKPCDSPNCQVQKMNRASNFESMVVSQLILFTLIVNSFWCWTWLLIPSHKILHATCCLIYESKIRILPLAFIDELERKIILLLIFNV